MTHVGRGSRLTLRVGDQVVVLRALADLKLDGDWRLPVLAPVPGLQDASGRLEVSAEGGAVTIGARLVHDIDGLSLRAEGAVPVIRVQRRHDVRGAVTLPVRAAVVDPRARGELADLAFDGATIDLSAGGLHLEPGHPGADRLPSGARLFIELELPDDVFVPAVVSLVESGEGMLRGAFVDIAAADRERIVQLVFAQQRRELAARARARGGSPIDHLASSRRLDPHGP